MTYKTCPKCGDDQSGNVDGVIYYHCGSVKTSKGLQESIQCLRNQIAKLREELQSVIGYFDRKWRGTLTRSSREIEK